MECDVDPSIEAWKFVDNLKHDFNDQEGGTGEGGGGGEKKRKKKKHCDSSSKYFFFL